HAPHGSGHSRGWIRDRADPARKHPQGAAHCQAEHSRNSAKGLDVHSLPQRLNEETMEDSSRDLQNDHLNSLVPDVRVDRRGFVAACLAAGFAVTAEPVLAQAIKTSMEGLDGGDIKIGDIPAYYAVPKTGGKRPVVLVVAEIWGLRPRGGQGGEVQGAQEEAGGGRRLVRRSHPDAARHAAGAGRRRGKPECAGAGALRRRRPGYSARGG